MESRGVLFVATGEGYREIARNAAQSVRRHCPGLEIDLFTDAPDESGIFDQVVVLDDPWFRSQIDAMGRTRFERTLSLDADVLVVADIRDIFEVLDRFDIVLAHDQLRNSPNANVFWRRELPNAFPQFNSGVVAYRRTPVVLDLLRNWGETLRASTMKRDQPMLRELLWESDLRIATLPPEYNLRRFREVLTWGSDNTAPRILHHYKLRTHFTGRRRRFSGVADLVGPRVAARLPLLIAGDVPLARMQGRSPCKPKARDWAWARIAALASMPLRFARNLPDKLARLLRMR